LLAQLRLNRHPMLQPLPGKQQPQCGCNRAKLTATHFVNGCSLWTRQRSTLLNEVRATLQNPELSATSLLDTLLREHTNAFTEWKMSDALWQYYSTTMG
jgi:lysozyme family protein